MAELGRVRAVVAEEFGTPLTADHAAGITVLSVQSAVDFIVTGGTLTYPDPADETTVVSATYASADQTADTVTLASPLAVNLDRDTFITADSDGREADLFAQVIIDEGDEPLVARVPHSLRDRLPEGVREPEDREAVEVEEDDGGEHYVSQVFGLTPTIGGEFVDSPSLGVYLTGDQSVAYATWQRVAWPSGSGNRHIRQPFGLPGHVEVLRTGRYIITGYVVWENEPGGTRRGRIVLTNETETGEVVLRETFGPVESSGASRFQVVTSRLLQAGDHIAFDVRAEPTAIGNVDIIGSPAGTATALELTYIAQV